MKHLLSLELLALTILGLSLQYNVIKVTVNTEPIRKNAKVMTLWLAGVIITAIISSWFN